MITAEERKLFKFNILKVLYKKKYFIAAQEIIINCWELSENIFKKLIKPVNPISI